MAHQSRGVTDDHDAMPRMVLSAWRKQQYLDFGGAMWCNFVIALGEASDGLVDFVNDEQMARTQANLQGTQSSQALAAAQGKNKNELTDSTKSLALCTWYLKRRKHERLRSNLTRRSRRRTRREEQDGLEGMERLAGVP